MNAVVELEASRATGELRMSRERIVRRIQQGELRGRYDERRGWLVDRDSIEEFKNRPAANAVAKAS